MQLGDQAPDFTLPDQRGNPVKLSGLRGRTVVLDFYPWADTPGSTAQACGVRDHRTDYAQAGAVVLGVSPDPVRRIAKFDNKYGLGFALLADEDNRVAEAYGVWVERSTHGRALIGNERTTVVISPDGTVSAVFRNIRPTEHDDLVLDALRGLERLNGGLVGRPSDSSPMARFPHS
jgi:thioredoxin-dependent peroxiredoxin